MTAAQSGSISRERIGRRRRGPQPPGAGEPRGKASAQARGRGGFGPRTARRIRARDGCLGAAWRRRARQAAKVRGEGQAPRDPRVPEWGNPAGREAGQPRPNQIRRGGDTRGSETSQYPEEEEENSNARVAASESARAQTGAHAPRGRGTGAWAPGGGRGTAWKGRPQGVRAPYATAARARRDPE